MRDFRLVLNYELLHQLGKKTTRVVTLMLMVLALAGTSIPRLIASFSGGKASAPAADTTLSKDVGYVFESQEQKDEYTELLSLSEDNYFDSRDEIVAALKDKSIRAGIVLDGDRGYEAVYQDKGVDDAQDRVFGEFMASHLREKMLAARGLTLSDYAAIETFAPQSKLSVLGKTTENNIMVSMVLMVAVYILVLMYGNITSVMIAREKDSKAMELLITSTKPTALIFGKVAAAGISGLVQFGAIILCALAGFLFNQEFYDPMIRQMLLGALSRSYVLSYLYFTITGYLLYLFLYAALGSTVSRVEDVNSATGLVQFILVAGYIASSFIVGMPNSLIARVTSLFPFTSIIVMPMRMGLTTVPAEELIISGLLMLAFMAFFAWLSVKIYRWGTLNYGNKTGILKVLGSVFKSNRRGAKG